MAKYTKRQELPKEKQEKLLIELCQSLSLIKNAKEAAQVLSDLLTSQELNMIAKRLQIAKLLIKGKSYDDITNQLNVSHQTIARVNIWLSEAGEGYRMLIKRQKKLPKIDLSTRKDFQGGDYLSWSSIKRRYPIYFWPQILLEEIVKLADKQQKKRLKSILKELKKVDKKSSLYKDLEKYL